MSIAPQENRVKPVVADEESAQTLSAKLSGAASRTVWVLGLGLALFTVYLAWVGSIDAMQQRSLLILFSVTQAYLLFPARPRPGPGRQVPWYDWTLAGLSVLVFGYVFVNGMDISARFAYVMPLSPLEMAIAAIGVLLVLESSRRVLGSGMFYLLLVLFAYLVVGPYIPGVLHHPGFTAMWSLDHLYFTTQGIFGIPAGIVITYVAIFVVFGSMLEAAGGGQFFIDLSLSLVGRVRGGPAKVAVFASGLLGSISGSPTANVLTTGVITIPMMRQLGYRASFAGAVEAAASTGGQILPPVMGAVAFLVAEYSGHPYVDVMVAAIVPALLYYISLVFVIDFEAARLNLVGLARDKVPAFWSTLKTGFYYILPIAAIVYFLLSGFSPMLSGFWALVMAYAVTWLRRQTWMSLRQVLDTLSRAGQSIVIPAVAVAAAGLIIGIISLTGVDLQITNIIIGAAGGNLFLGLVLTMFTCIILGMGMPPVAAYLIQVAFTIPALIEMGAPQLAAHMFVFYFLVFSFVTPPVAIAAYTAAGLTGASATETGFIAWRLSLAAFIVPFAFIYGPGLLVQGGALAVVRDTITGLIGVFALAAGSTGWLLIKVEWWERILLIAAAVALIAPEVISNWVGLGLLVTALVTQWQRRKALGRSGSQAA